MEIGRRNEGIVVGGIWVLNRLILEEREFVSEVGLVDGHERSALSFIFELGIQIWGFQCQNLQTVSV